MGQGTVRPRFLRAKRQKRLCDDIICCAGGPRIIIACKGCSHPLNAEYAIA